MNLKNNKGQTLYYFLVFTMILVLSWAMMLNIAKLIRDRMVMQNIADNAALSIATHRARAMNIVGGCNYLIGAFLAIGTRGEFVQIRNYGTDMVAAYHFGDNRQLSNFALSADVAKLKTVVDAIQETQEKVMQAHVVYVYSVYADLIGKGFVPVISPTPVEFPTVETAEEYFGLTRNTKGITYKKTENVTIGQIHYVYTRMLGMEFKRIFMEQARTFPGIGGLFEFFGGNLDAIWNKIEEILGITISDYTEAPTYARKDTSWYITTDNFHKQKIKVRLAKAGSRQNSPLFARALDISYPDMVMFSAASIYNTKGTMFPQRESELLGTLSADLEAALFVGTQAQMGILDNQLLAIPLLGELLALAVSLYIESSYIGMLKMYIDGIPDSPMNNYRKAKDGGWAAHLVPYGTHQEEAENEDGSG